MSAMIGKIYFVMVFARFVLCRRLERDEFKCVGLVSSSRHGILGRIFTPRPHIVSYK